MFTAVAIDNYGLVRKDNEYEVIEEGRDWYLVRVAGQANYVFRWVFE